MALYRRKTLMSRDSFRPGRFRSPERRSPYTTATVGGPMSTLMSKLSTLACIAAMLGALSSTAILASAHAQTGSRTAAHAAKKHHRHHRRHHHGIPQHNGGDHDADNNGGPTDGDGNV